MLYFLFMVDLLDFTLWTVFLRPAYEQVECFFVCGSFTWNELPLAETRLFQNISEILPFSQYFRHISSLGNWPASRSVTI